MREGNCFLSLPCDGFAHDVVNVASPFRWNVRLSLVPTPPTTKHFAVMYQGSIASHMASQEEDILAMTYVITQPCVGVKDASCVDVCPVDCIHPAHSEAGFESTEQLS